MGNSQPPANHTCKWTPLCGFLGPNVVCLKSSCPADSLGKANDVFILVDTPWKGNCNIQVFWSMHFSRLIYTRRCLFQGHLVRTRGGINPIAWPLCHKILLPYLSQHWHIWGVFLSLVAVSPLWNHSGNRIFLKLKLKVDIVYLKLLYFMDYLWGDCRSDGKHATTTSSSFVFPSDTLSIQ